MRGHDGLRLSVHVRCDVRAWPRLRCGVGREPVLRHLRVASQLQAIVPHEQQRREPPAQARARRPPRGGLVLRSVHVRLCRRRGSWSNDPTRRRPRIGLRSRRGRLSARGAARETCKPACDRGYLGLARRRREAVAGSWCSGRKPLGQSRCDDLSVCSGITAAPHGPHEKFPAALEAGAYEAVVQENEPRGRREARVGGR